MVGVIVGDVHLVHLDQAGGPLHLALRPLAAVEQEPLAAYPRQQAGCGAPRGGHGAAGAEEYHREVHAPTVSALPPEAVSCAAGRKTIMRRTLASRPSAGCALSLGRAAGRECPDIQATLCAARAAGGVAAEAGLPRATQVFKVISLEAQAIHRGTFGCDPTAAVVASSAPRAETNRSPLRRKVDSERALTTNLRTTWLPDLSSVPPLPGERPQFPAGGTSRARPPTRQGDYSGGRPRACTVFVQHDRATPRCMEPETGRARLGPSAPVAQLDRARASGARGHRFESCRARLASAGRISGCQGWRARHASAISIRSIMLG